jgi:hypothetical protein
MEKNLVSEQLRAGVNDEPHQQRQRIGSFFGPKLPFSSQQALQR